MPHTCHNAWHLKLFCGIKLLQICGHQQPCKSCFYNIGHRPFMGLSIISTRNCIHLAVYYRSKALIWLISRSAFRRPSWEHLFSDSCDWNIFLRFSEKSVDSLNAAKNFVWLFLLALKLKNHLFDAKIFIEVEVFFVKHIFCLCQRFCIDGTM